MNCAFISGAHWSPRSWSHHHMSACRSSLRFPWTTKVFAAISLLVFPESNKAEKNNGFSTSILVTWWSNSTCFPPLGSQMSQCLQEQHLGPAGPFVSLLAKDLLWLGPSKPSVDFKNHRPLFVQRNILKLLHCVKIYLCVC